MEASTYQPEVVKSPRLSGVPLRAFVELLETPAGKLVLRKLARDAGLDTFRSLPVSGSPIRDPLPSVSPVPKSSPSQSVLAEQCLAAPVQLPGGYAPESAAQFSAAYRSGQLTPVEVANRVLDAISELGRGERSLGVFIASYPENIRAQAQASANRYREGRPLSALDGVPIAIKDEMDLAGYPTTLGTSFLGTQAATKDATIVARLRQAGAVLLGKTNMHEVGINPIGLNPHHGASRNPYDRTRITGGSSSGSAAAVASGICPISVGADGGGSTRIPSALCGIVGLKPTYQRLSSEGVAALCWTMGHVGIMGATVRDVAAAYCLMAGPDPLDPSSRHQPPVHLTGLESPDLSGVRLGVCRPYFEDADPAVVDRCDAALQALVRAGARVVEVPAPNLLVELWTNSILILSEMVSVLRPHMQEDVRRFGLDTRTNMAIGSFFTSTDYVHALRHRRAQTERWLETLREVDLVVTPTTGTPALSIPEHALPEGESNLEVTTALMRFIRAGNITGLPAISVPAGYSPEGLPVGLQLTARPWEEHLLFRAGLAVERTVERRPPAIGVRLLQRRGA